MNAIESLRKLGMFIVFLLVMLPLPSHALFAGMADVDKPTGSPTTFDGYGYHTNILANWTNTCWQAVSASMLGYRGYGATSDIYDWFHTTYGNVTATLTQWRDRINTYTASHQSAQGTFYAASVNLPTDDWAENTITESPIGLIVDVSGYLTGCHAIAYGGYDDNHDWSWIADPDADWRDTLLSTPASYFDWSLFDDLAGIPGYDWRIARTWNDGTQLVYNVFGAVVLFAPEPDTVALLLSGMLAMAFLRKRRAGVR